MRQGLAVHESQQGVGTGGHGQGLQQSGSSFGSSRQAHRTLGPGESMRAPGTRGEQARQALGERATCTPRIETAETTDVELKLNRAARGGQVRRPSDIGAVGRVAVLLAGGARCAAMFGLYNEDGSRGLHALHSLQLSIGNRVPLAHRRLYASGSLPAVTPLVARSRNTPATSHVQRHVHIKCGRAT